MDISVPHLQMNRWKLLGHDWAVDMLSEHLRSNNARHAYLISGPSGVGRRTLALRFIQGMNCPNPPEPGEGCTLETCRTCRQILEMQHADLKVVSVPQGKSEILIDQIRELQSFLMLSPYEAPYKVGLLLNFERATVQAQNALLKTLEEAPPRARILITADSGESLLPTILSRCELLRLRPLAPGGITAELVSRGIPTNRAELIDHLSAGRFGYAIELSEDESLLDHRVEMVTELIRSLSTNLRGRFRMVENLVSPKGDLSTQRREARDVLFIWQSIFRDMLLCHARASERMMNRDFLVDVQKLAARYSVAQIEKLITGCDLALERIDHYCNTRLVMEVFIEQFN